MQRVEKYIADLIAQILIYVFVYGIDAFAKDMGLDNGIVSFLALIFCFATTRLVIRALGFQNYFGNFVNWSVHYTVFLAACSWIPYMLFIRMRQF